MTVGVPLGDLAVLVAALAASGLLMGFLAGLLGIGGGAILVPILYEIFTMLGIDEVVRLHLCIGTGLAVMVPTSLRSFRAHYLTGAVDSDFVRSMAIPVVIGVIGGSLIARIAAHEVLAAIFAGCAALLSLRLYLGRETWVLGHTIPGQPFRTLFGTFVGLVSTLMSIGGAAFITALMMLYGRKIHQAIATSSGIGPMIAVPGTIGMMWAGWGATGLPPGSIGYVNLIGAALVAPLSVVIAPLGVHVSHRIPRRALELCVATLLATISIRFLLLVF